MACLFIVDDDADNARQLADVLLGTLSGSHRIICLQGLQDYRQQRQRHRPDIILVELQRQQSNGFTLAAALARQSLVQVVLLTDRSLSSDHIWASARGVGCVLGRRCGPMALAKHIGDLLDGRGGPLACYDKPSCLQPAILDKRLAKELVTSPESALLLNLAAELRLMTAPPASPCRWINSLSSYIRDPEICAALEVVAGTRASSTATDWQQAREHLLVLLEPDAVTALRWQCEQEWHELSRQINSGYVDPPIQTLQYHLLQALAFLPEYVVDIEVPPTQSGVLAPDLVARIVRCLEGCDGNKALTQLISHGCLRVLAEIANMTDEQYRVHKKVWRELAGLGLALRAITARQCWHPVVRHALSGLYEWQDQRRLSAASLVELLPGLLANNLAGSTKTDRTTTDNDNEQISDETAHKLIRALTDMLSVLQQMNEPCVGQRSPMQSSLSSLMVSSYKLRSWLGFSVEPGAQAADSAQRWRLVIACLYQCVCHGVQQSDVLGQDDIRTLTEFVRALTGCAEQRAVPAENMLMNMAALEITVSRRVQSGSDQDHQLLAAGLHRLPRPESIVADLIADIKGSGTLLSEIICELRLLTEGAQRLGVVRVESLARLLLDCYQQLERQPELLQRRTSRLALGRGHRVLCRLLDQAAAWLPLEQPAGELLLSAAIDGLFEIFEDTAGKSPMPGAVADPDQAAWLRCRSLNRRLRQLIRRPGHLSEYRSLMAELLSEQQAVMTPYLPYQSRA